MSDLREQLLTIRKGAGKLTPQIVVDAARPPESPLHGKFEWDDSIAGEAFRRTQAAELIRSVRVRYLPPNDGPPSSIRAFHATSRPDIGHAYDPVEEILDDPIQRQLLLRDMERDWKAMKRRYESLREFWEAVANDLAASA